MADRVQVVYLEEVVRIQHSVFVPATIGIDR